MANRLLPGEDPLAEELDYEQHRSDHETEVEAEFLVLGDRARMALDNHAVEPEEVDACDDDHCEDRPLSRRSE